MPNIRTLKAYLYWKYIIHLSSIAATKNYINEF